MDTFMRNLPHWVHAAGVLAMILGYGLKNTIDNNPDELAQYGSLSDCATILGALTTFSGIALGFGKDKKQQSDLKEARAAPPIGTDGKPDVRLTVAAAIHQAIADDDDDLAHRLTSALNPPDKSKDAIADLTAKLDALTAKVSPV